MPMMADYHEIVSHYESCLARFGDDCRGVDWPNAADAQTRYRIMLELIRASDPRPLTVLDFGCGVAHLLDYLQQSDTQGIRYLGLDISPQFVELSRRKHPAHEFVCADVLQGDAVLPAADYVVLNGVFTEKRSLTFEAMFDYMGQVLKRVFAATRRGIAFNVMSKHVDWEREDLFHVPFDRLAAFLRAEVSRNIAFRADYGLYEYTTYVYR